jgi:hypothetical protein
MLASSVGAVMPPGNIEPHYLNVLRHLRLRRTGAISAKITVAEPVVPKSVTALVVFCLVALVDVTHAARSPQASAAASASASAEQALLNRYCVSCHNDRLRTAGIALSAGIETPGSDAERWEKVVRELRAGVTRAPAVGGLAGRR